DLSIVHGNHSFKTGVDYVWEPTLGGYFEFNPTLTLGWFDDPSIIASNSNGKYPQGFATPGALQSMALAGGNPAFEFSAKMLGGYFQDDWKIRHNLTLNLGLRYDKDFGLYGENVIPQSRTYLELKAINSPYASSIPDPDSKDFSPRVGFAYSFGSSGRQVIRGGYGIYYGQTFINIPLFMVQQANPVLFATLFSISHGGVGAACSNCTVPGTSIPLASYRWGVDPVPVAPPPPTSLPAGATGRLVDPNFRNPMSQQFNLGYSIQVSNSSVIEVDLVHELANHEPKTVNINPQTCATCARILASAFTNAGQPALGSISNNEAISNSQYNGGNVSYRRRMSHNIAFTSTYTLSWARSYRGSAASFGNTATDPFAPLRAVDFGYVPNDERHRWVNSATVNLPWGFQIAPIMQLASARPYNITEGISDVLGFGSGNGASDAIVLNSAPNNFTATAGYTATQLRACLAAATCHELPFDFARGQGFFQLDSRVTKNIKLGENKELGLIFQGFDLTNRANFGNTFQGNIRSSIFGRPTGYITPAGVIVPKSFRAEFGARFAF
ncbi:MAG TPA: TonB-dependent receptor, partial [Gemmataceae bacterium]|nr:TonB-dependent receptor [Gemmataceae bacterium]